ncbi:hypothetical protein [Sandarakinorhabdus sp.]|uniref:hypothetical protein n=1 Tax=Sandarakinorhabdus sp. TaxID=1916663 RepID=UPI00333E3802
MSVGLMTKHRLLFPALLSVFVTGCAQTVSMFPTAGPLKNQTPLPVLQAKADNITSNSGKFSVTYPNGDKCVGRWSSVAPQMTSVSWGSLFSQYGAISGVATSVSNLPGINRGEAVAVCGSGNQLTVEFYTGSGTANGLGVAKDEQGNIFKLIF